MKSVKTQGKKPIFTLFVHLEIFLSDNLAKNLEIHNAITLSSGGSNIILIYA